MPRSFALNHVAIAVPPGTLTDSFRAKLLDFYGSLLGWREIERLRLPDRLTVLVGDSSYINLRERPDVTGDEKYEHFGVVVGSSQEVDEVWETLRARGLVEAPVGDLAGGGRSLLYEHMFDDDRGSRAHRDSSEHELCWHHPALWGLLPERTDPVPVVPEWPQFMRGCVEHRQSLDVQAPQAARTARLHRG